MIRFIEKSEYSEAVDLIRESLFSEPKGGWSEKGAADVLSFLNEKLPVFETIGLYDHELKAVLVYEEENCHIVLLAVRRADQHHGYGRRLLEDFRKKMDQKNYPRVTVNAAEGAVPFYMKAGFEAAGDMIKTDGLQVQPMEYLLGKDWLGRKVHIIVDHPLGSIHPYIADEIYPVNAGYIRESSKEDGNLIEAYAVGINEPLEYFTGYCAAVIYRNNGPYKIAAALPGALVSHEDIINAVAFEEQYYETRIVYADQEEK